MYFDSPNSPAATSLIASAILSASEVTRQGLSSHDEDVRNRAADDLAQAIIARLEADARQLKFDL
jgi:hypothetical protein